jgi:hypothetical protein
MRIKLDENLPESLLASLAAFGHDVDNVRLEGIAGRADSDVWQAAPSGSRLLITQGLAVCRGIFKCQKLCPLSRRAPPFPFRLFRNVPAVFH